MTKLINDQLEKLLERVDVLFREWENDISHGPENVMPWIQNAIKLNIELKMLQHHYVTQHEDPEQLSVKDGFMVYGLDGLIKDLHMFVNRVLNFEIYPDIKSNILIEEDLSPSSLN